MSFLMSLGKKIDPLGASLGVYGTDVATPAPPAAAPIAPTAANSQDAMDISAQRQAQAMQGGTTSTMLNGATGVDDTKNTSKILLGR
jgi:hypothetical protein